eukprot:CAMPEP_0119106662 /NCGR_PEP_ID=MMETSP1180-20130426/5810_1 /TAXON_ID=3052 ORGANISM="Chlamydomonas cf sp, Strain CCMP681" /NCGR_SAMPLE_ID=MMETSP1180 /ASSEMBLY_ACC=CAM_ASM_000741 /LENGTH=782 /DNA_ID=CAMNT_0007092035 /DNA_START=102 /DNA_END=2450 /DNA_ORIENTATION=-
MRGGLASSRCISGKAVQHALLAPVQPILRSLAPSFAAQHVMATQQPRRSMACAAAEAPEKEAAEAPKEETHTYAAEVDRLMDMIVNSLYSNREVFLRELISNASDALDKARFVSLTKPELLKGRDQLEILIRADKDANTITIEDSGIGMNREALLENLGTIARSGTRKFMEMVKEQKAAGGSDNLIGQFGVGFYSSFLVADRVVVQSRGVEEGDQVWCWEAKQGSHEYKLYLDPNQDSMIRGSRVTLHLKEDAAELADPVRLARLIKQYSQFISFPIKLYSMKKEPIKVIDEDATKRKQDAENKIAAEKTVDPKTVEPVMKTDYAEAWDWRVENENKPIWTRNPKEVSNEDYNGFFKQTFSEFLDPLAHVHFNVEGTIEFSSILYIPGMAPFDQQAMTQRSKSIKLFVKRVFISDEFDDDLMPRYLSFVKGVVDSSDLPLNVSREILQESRIVRVIRKQLVRRSIEMIEDLAGTEGGEDFKTFWEAFGRNLKIGVIEDTENRERLSKLLRFYSSKSEEGLTSLTDYTSRMKEGQKSIYYMAADNIQGARAAPFVEKLVSKGLEVLYLTDAIDEAVVTNMQKFGELELVDVSKEGLELEGEEQDKGKEEALAKEFDVVVQYLKKTLGDRVEKVTVSNRLTDSPCALVTSKFGWSANMERIMRTQALGDPRSMDYMKGRKILEINPESDIIMGIKNLLADNQEDQVRDLAELLYETALITSGFQVESPKDYAFKVFTLMKFALSGGQDIGEERAEASSPSQPPAVEAEVMPVDPNDPWGTGNRN